MKRILFFAFIFFLQENLSARLPDLIPYRKGNLWGYCDSTKKMIIPAKYDIAFQFWDGTAIVVSKEKDIIVDVAGNEIVLGDSVFINEDEAHHGVRIFTDTHTNRQGLIDDKGNVILQPTYVFLKWISKDYMYVYKQHCNKIAVYDFRGRQILGFEYPDPDFNGYQYEDGEQNTDNGKFILYNSKDNYGIVDTLGHIIVPFIYYDINDIGCGYYRALTKDSTFVLDENCQKIWSAKRPSRKALRKVRGWPINSEFGLEPIPISPFEKNCRKQEMENMLFYFAERTGDKNEYKYGFLNSKRDTIIKAKYDIAYLFQETGLAWIGKYTNGPNGDIKFLGYIDIYGTEYWED